jgi:hypothetical protein
MPKTSQPCRTHDVVKNPDPSEIPRIFDASPHNAAKWLRVGVDHYFWPADERFHQQVADALGVRWDDKGLATPD